MAKELLKENHHQLGDEFENQIFAIPWHHYTTEIENSLNVK